MDLRLFNLYISLLFMMPLMVMFAMLYENTNDWKILVMVVVYLVFYLLNKILKRMKNNEIHLPKMLYLIFTLIILIIHIMIISYVLIKIYQLNKTDFSFCIIPMILSISLRFLICISEKKGIS